MCIRDSYGPTPKEILKSYTAYTGRPALPPAWSFGLWLSTSFTTNYDEETTSSFIQGMADRDIDVYKRQGERDAFLQKVMQTARDLLEADEVKSAAQEDMKEMLQAAGEKLSNDKISFTGCEVYNFEVYEREDY